MADTTMFRIGGTVAEQLVAEHSRAAIPSREIVCFDKEVGFHLALICFNQSAIQVSGVAYVENSFVVARPANKQIQRSPISAEEEGFHDCCVGALNPKFLFVP